MGKILLTFGVKAIIVVSAEVKILDSVASIAGPHIYKELVQNGKSISQAFNAFKEFLINHKAHLCNICCCEHPHEPECPWNLKRESEKLSWEQVSTIYSGPQSPCQNLRL